MHCKPERLGEGSKIGKSPKVVKRGCKRSFGPTAQRSPKSHLHHVQPSFAPVQPQVAPVQEAFRSLGSKDLLHPLLTTFGDFPIFDPSPRRSGLQFLHELFCVIGRLHKVFSVNVPITEMNCLELIFQLHAHLLHNRTVSELFV